MKSDTRTLAIIKPDAVGSGLAGKVLAVLEDAGLSLVEARVVTMSRAQAEAFYEIHSERPFFGDLVDFMTSGPCMPLALEGPDAVPLLRKVIGATDPAEAAPGTVRGLYAEDKSRNAVHGSDSNENAQRELAFFFGEADLLG